MLAGIAQWLTYIYVLLFLLHFIPAFPLDGGHILRTILWKTTGDYYKATHIASLIGMAVGFFLIFAGVLIFIVTQQWIISLLMAVIGWIIEIAAGYTRRRVKANIALRNTRAEDIMTREYPVMPQQMSIGQLIREQILIKGCRYIIVADDGKMKGILTMDQIRSIPGRRWNKTTLGDVMIPSDRIKAANLQQAADTLLDEMRLQSIDYIPVLKDNDIAGVVTRQALMDLVKIRTGFGV
jgi:predicted transcriptional regulator